MYNDCSVSTYPDLIDVGVHDTRARPVAKVAATWVPRLLLLCIFTGQVETVKELSHSSR